MFFLLHCIISYCILLYYSKTVGSDSSRVCCIFDGISYIIRGFGSRFDNSIGTRGVRCGSIRDESSGSYCSLYFGRSGYSMILVVVLVVETLIIGVLVKVVVVVVIYLELVLLVVVVVAVLAAA